MAFFVNYIKNCRVGGRAENPLPFTTDEIFQEIDKDMFLYIATASLFPIQKLLKKEHGREGERAGANHTTYCLTFTQTQIKHCKLI